MPDNTTGYDIGSGVMGALSTPMQYAMQNAVAQNNMNNAKDMSRYNTGQQMALMNYSQAQQYEMWKKTGPAGQVQQLKEAGLNPGLLYGMGGGGGQTTGQSSGQAQIDVSAGQKPVPTMDILGQQMMIAQIKNINADTKNKEEETPNIPLKGANIAASTGLILQQTKSEEWNTEIQKWNEATANWNSGIAANLATISNETMTTEIAKAKQELINLQNAGKSLAAKGKVDEATVDTTIKQAKTNLAQTIASIALTKAETKLTGQLTDESKKKIEVMSKQISNMIQDNMRRWDELGQGQQALSQKQQQIIMAQLQQEFDMDSETAQNVMDLMRTFMDYQNKAPQQRTPIGFRR